MENQNRKQAWNDLRKSLEHFLEVQQRPTISQTEIDTARQEVERNEQRLKNQEVA